MEEERAHDAERAAMRLRRLVAALVAVAGIAVVLAVAAFIQRDRASRARTLADERAVESRKQTYIALEARRAASERADEALRQATIAAEAKKEAEQQTRIATEAKEEAERQTRIATARRVAAQAATNQAEALAKIATSRQLAALSVAERDKRLDRSLLLAVAALQIENTLEARKSVYNALESRPELTSFLHFHEGVVASVAFSPDGKTIAAGSGGAGGGGVVLWDVAARKRLADEPLPVKEGNVLSVAFSPDGKTIAAGYSVTRGGSGVVLWDVAAANAWPTSRFP